MSEPEEDFGAMFEASLQAKSFDKGQTVEGTIVEIGAEVAFVDIGGKSEAVIAIDELQNAEGIVDVGVGDRVQAIVMSTAGGLTLSRKLARGGASDRQLEDAFHAGLPVDGAVERVVKGGYEVRIGRQRAFCPLSQIDTVRTTDAAVHVGRVHTFRIIEYKDNGRTLVVSRRVWLEEEQRIAAEAVRRTVAVDAVMTGRVVSVRDFGAFVDLGGGVQGLLHVSEMGWSRVVDASQAVSPGETLTVKVLRVDPDTQRIALGLKQLTDDPWANVPATYEVGQVRTGRVTRLTDFGAFVELEPGVEGLAHASTFAPTGRSDGWTRLVPVGTTAAFEILSVEPERRRIGIAIAPEGSTRAAAATSSHAVVPGARVTGKVERHETFGVFLFLAPGRTAFMPTSETGVTRDADVAKAFPIGSDVEVVVLEVDASGRRIRVSRKAVQDAEDADELREYAARPDAAPTEGLGSLADKLRGALSPKAPKNL
ncbi:MAG: S1 RNA-binding domain-containing protein [Vicinamibacterales bacterium]